MSGFMSPGVLFFHAHQSERDLTATLAKALSGRYRLVEPCAGAFAMALVYRQCGHNPRYFDTSDVLFFSTVLGYAITATPFEDLGAEIDGMPFQPTGNHARDAAILLFEQQRLKLEEKQGAYWSELRKSLFLHRDQHVEHLAGSIRQLIERLRGMRYRPLCMWRHLEEVAPIIVATLRRLQGRSPLTIDRLEPPGDLRIAAAHDKIVLTRGNVRGNLWLVELTDEPWPCWGHPAQTRSINPVAEPPSWRI